MPGSMNNWSTNSAPVKSYPILPVSGIAVIGGSPKIAVPGPKHAWQKVSIEIAQPDHGQRDHLLSEKE
ncbi:hypothetical protein DSCW_34200 [Desulfosarcina widdelii]|uniref:Uncharacterized protein n=1 Tax=Desulfosarcina widdelii TaxID=947919 RepID=A0A5K7Z817_9BACT|nr:hypothetical protein DSCW_34200 [Desulfosarcina widdelii]